VFRSFSCFVSRRSGIKVIMKIQAGISKTLLVAGCAAAMTASPAEGAGYRSEIKVRTCYYCAEHRNE